MKASRRAQRRSPSAADALPPLKRSAMPPSPLPSPPPDSARSPAAPTAPRSPLAGPLSPPLSAHSPADAPREFLRLPLPGSDPADDLRRARIARSLRAALEKTARDLDAARRLAALLQGQGDIPAVPAALDSVAELDAYLAFQLATLRRLGRGERLDPDAELCVSLMVQSGWDEAEHDPDEDGCWDLLNEPDAMEADD